MSFETQTYDPPDHPTTRENTALSQLWHRKDSVFGISHNLRGKAKGIILEAASSIREYSNVIGGTIEILVVLYYFPPLTSCTFIHDSIQKVVSMKYCPIDMNDDISSQGLTEVLELYEWLSFRLEVSFPDRELASSQKATCSMLIEEFLERVGWQKPKTKD